MREKRLQTKKGTVFYWLSDEWDKSKENIIYWYGMLHVMENPDHMMNFLLMIQQT